VTPEPHFDRIVATLETSLQAPLPGLAAQALMARSRRVNGLRGFSCPTSGTRPDCCCCSR
jgi:hypothetical protein